jgi:ankyrin repeat protein
MLLPACWLAVSAQLLRRMLRAGAPVNFGDYDGRTPLHISAAEGNAVMVSASSCCLSQLVLLCSPYTRYSHTLLTILPLALPPPQLLTGARARGGGRGQHPRA